MTCKIYTIFRLKIISLLPANLPDNFLFLGDVKLK